ncbi:hypothetical protein P1X15_27425 [Runella sp. MFBS21]|uniref:hypothetical protein n=1 Tax=Runella sp. MFBS21 TaxID=3034018 RepID=UPI0023F9B09F|nr:hypothetical protein [Runella sp. MFBS21]MDF7821385.1 hypothetical protein [Runella sp. MFBS21]
MNIEEYRKHLFHPKYDNYLLLRHLKQEDDLLKIKKIYKNISNHPFIKSIFRSNLVAKNYSDLRKQKTAPFSGNFIGESAFYLINLGENKLTIKSFIKLKSDFESAFLLENYDLAESMLQEIEKLTGKSHWLIENKLLLKEHKEGVQSNWNEVSSLSEIVKDPLVLLFIENLSKKAETKISYFRYLNIFSNQISELQHHHPLLYEYLCFRLNYSAFTGYENLAFLLFVESSSPLVDRYLILKDVLSELLTSHFSEYSGILLLITKELHELFPEDTQLCQILSIKDYSFINKIPTNYEISQYINEYSIGNYKYCISNAQKLILLYPSIIEVYEIYIKSIIESNLEASFSNFPTHIKNILTTLFNIYTSQDKIEQTIDLGLKICTSFSATNWSKQFLSLIKSSTSVSNGNKLFTIQYIIHSEIQNPRIIYYSDKQNIDDIIRELSKNRELEISVKILSNIINGNYEAIAINSNLTISKRELHFGRALMKALKFKEAMIHFESLLKMNPINSMYEEELIVNLFRCYIKLKLNKEACCLFVKQFLKKKETTKRLNKIKLLEAIENGEIEKLAELIELPIFYKVASIDSYQQYVAYDTYLENQFISRPTDLFNKIETPDKKMIFFLKEVCTIEVMHHSYHFNGTDDIENERLNILNKLIVIDNENEDSYIKEITELNQNVNIRKAIREVNKGRITVNVQQLRNNETNNVKEAFNRYKEIETYSKNNELRGIDTSAQLLNELSNANLDELLGTKVVYTNDPAFISFKVIFFEIRDKFLLSKEYGLDGYLSTRIRHGTLLNHIRSTFESENIISQRDKDNVYLEIDAWNNATPSALMDKRTKIQESIKKFSRSIDEYTEFLIKELIQVKTEKHLKKSKALFDYSISNNELAFLFATARENIKDHNIFLSFVFEYLQRNTEKLLSKIRDIINSEVKDNYNRILQDFNTDVKDIIGSLSFPELTNAIGLCGTKIQNELKNISEWFFLSNTSKDLILDLKVLIQTAIQITNTIYPNSRLNPKIIEENSIPMVGTIHIIYICRILLDNIINHSKVHPSELDIEISSKVTDDEFLEISFRNNLSDKVNKDDLRNKLQQVKNKWDISSDDFENIDIEGGSGFNKIRRIIAFDLGCESYHFDFSIQDNFLTIKLSIEFLNIPKYDEEN